MNMRASDVVLGVGIGIILAALLLGVYLRIDSDPLPDLPTVPNPPSAGEPEGEPRFVYEDEAAVTPPAVVVTRQGNKLIDIVINDDRGVPIAVIQPNGNVAVNGPVEEAAMRFWEALGKHRSKCEPVH